MPPKPKPFGGGQEGSAGGGGGCPPERLDSLDGAESLLQQIGNGEGDDEVMAQNKRFRELIRLYKQQQESKDPTSLERIRRELIQLFVAPGMSNIEMRMLIRLFKVTEFSSVLGIDKARYDVLVENFIKNKCLVALTELLSIPRIFQLVFDLFLHFYYRKSKVRMAIAATYLGAKGTVVTFLGLPFVTLVAEGSSIMFQIMVFLFQFVNNPQELLRQLDGSFIGGVVHNLLSVLPDHVRIIARTQLNTLLQIVRDNMFQPWIIVAAIAEVLMKLIDYLQDPGNQPAIAAAAAPAAAPAPGGVVGNIQYYVWRGGVWVYSIALTNLEQIKHNLTTMLGAAQLGEKERSNIIRLCNFALNGATVASNMLDAQAGVAFNPEQVRNIKRDAVFKALFGSNLHVALEKEDPKSVETEVDMLCASIKPRVLELCAVNVVISPDDQLRIAGDFFNAGLTQEALHAYVMQLPFPRHVDIAPHSQGSDMAQYTQSQDQEQRIRTLTDDMLKVLVKSEPLNQQEKRLKEEAIKSFFGGTTHMFSSAARAAAGLCSALFAPAADAFDRYKESAFVRGRDPTTIIPGPLLLTHVILSRVAYITHKQKAGEPLTLEEQIVLNSFLRTWAHDPNAVTYHNVSDGTGRWFVNIGSAVFCIRDDKVRIDQTLLDNHPDIYGDVVALPEAVTQVAKLLSCGVDTSKKVVGGWIDGALNWFAENPEEAVMKSGGVDPDAEAAIDKGEAKAKSETAAAAGGGGGKVSDPLADKQVDKEINAGAAVADVLAVYADAAGAAAEAADADEAQRQADAAAAQRQAEAQRVADAAAEAQRQAAAPRATKRLGPPIERSGGKSRRKSHKNAKKTTRRGKGRKSSQKDKKTHQIRARRSKRTRRSSRKGRK